MIRRKKIIQVPPGTVDKICKALRCHKTAVYDALSYATDSDLANMIREQAINNYGGVRTTKLVLR